MTKQELLQHLQDIEWDNFEVKKAENQLPQSCWDTVSAFANTSGGWLVLGGLLFLGKNEEITDTFSDFRIEFENPGSLPLPVEQLMKIDESLPRNPVLAKFFRIAKLCESGGYGFDKMLEWKKQTGNDVTFETSIGNTKFTFMIDTTKATIGEGGMESGTKGGTKIEESGTIEKNSGTKGGTKNKILLLIESNNSISLTQLSKEVGINRSAIQKHIDNLKEKGIIYRDGVGKGGKWIITNK